MGGRAEGTEPAAKGLERSHPLPAAKANVGIALRILQAKNSRYYDAALGNLEYWSLTGY